MREVRGTSGPRISGWAPTYGAPVLHQLRIARSGADRGGRRGGRRLSRWARVSTWILLAGVCACVHHPPPPGPGMSQGVPPDLRGTRVMLLPVQQSTGISGNLDSELAFALQARGPQVHWVLPASMDSALVLSPGLQTRTHGLPVAAFGAAEIKRIGDPLYGDLRRLGAVANADVALLPVQASMVQDTTGSAVRLWAALVEVRTGRVLWYGIVQGDSGAAGSERVLASAADKLARTVLGEKAVGATGG